MRRKWRPCAVGRRGGVKGAGQLKKEWRHYRVGREGTVEEWRVLGACETVAWYGRRLVAALGGAATRETSMGEGAWLLVLRETSSRIERICRSAQTSTKSLHERRSVVCWGVRVVSSVIVILRSRHMMYSIARPRRDLAIRVVGNVTRSDGVDPITVLPAVRVGRFGAHASRGARDTPARAAATNACQ